VKENHRIVLTHEDFRPGNIMVHNGVVTGIVDCESGGAYPATGSLSKERGYGNRRGAGGEV